MGYAYKSMYVAEQAAMQIEFAYSSVRSIERLFSVLRVVVVKQNWICRNTGGRGR